MSEDPEHTAYNFWREHEMKYSRDRLGLSPMVEVQSGWFFIPLASEGYVGSGSRVKACSEKVMRPFTVDKLIISEHIAPIFSLVNLKVGNKEIVPINDTSIGVPCTLFRDGQTSQTCLPVRVHTGDVIEAEVICHDICAAHRFWAALRGTTP